MYLDVIFSQHAPDKTNAALTLPSAFLNPRHPPPLSPLKPGLFISAPEYPYARHTGNRIIDDSYTVYRFGDK